MASVEIALTACQWIVVNVVEILTAEFPVALAGTLLVGEEKIFGDGVRLVPRPVVAAVIGAPLDAMFDGMSGRVQHGGVRGLFENGDRIPITGEAAGVE